MNVNWAIIFNIMVFIILIFGLIIINSSILSKLMCYELMYLYININFSICGYMFDDFTCHIFIPTIPTIIAAESAIVLSLVVLHYNLGGQLQIGD